MTGLLSLVNLLVLAYSVSGAPLPLQALDETAVVVESGSGGLDRDAVDAKAPGGKDNDLQTPDLDKSNAVHDLADAKPPDEKIALVDDLLIAGAVGMAGGALLGGAASRPQATQVVYEAPPQPCPYGRYAPACKNWPGYSGGASNGLGSDYYHGPHHYGRALDAVVDAKPPGLDRDAVDAKAPGGKDNDLQTPDLDKSNAVHDLADAKPPDEKIALVDDLLIAGAVGMAGGALLGGAASRPQAQVIYGPPPQAPPCPNGQFLAYVGDRLRCTDHYRA
ncbi:hypothetical protein EMIHUDRAFT_437155 [Emiliania huxleyi CCMP1516]|uniref:Uncharacterized protein n=2 Tax=Emiliania huxleyi TaxID=2903 RepID=A0A0D3IP95_EMIH1|nr:hypothetical protein EMIHUDRAFT_437155 [Emiliania huxleyi CCMP1516]EOD13080.1 hypothetical protein EMIHUDRAFT_437155 [Emiliania huxleyi CCMP1516]|mmetsp:Transcript_10416/g.30246  ORF Transcript_10416/g.30246 Transcript_10416/m.30246 type:complete len:277 (+) Transcript_10416:42-872(+)|eukprot:XP_005765509.1 hypothetical protein EMIHUDRAFT_437155 [Emiliania huxleyi CCMP1516]